MSNGSGEMKLNYSGFDEPLTKEMIRQPAKTFKNPERESLEEISIM